MDQWNNLQKIDTVKRGLEQALVDSGALSDTVKLGLESLINEMNTYRLELEIQNRELKQANDDLSEIRDHYRDLFDYAPVSCFILGDNNRIIEVNLTACTLLDRQREELLNSTFTDLIFGEDLPLYEARCIKPLKRKENRQCRLRLLKNDCSLQWVRLEITSLDELSHIAAVDITNIIEYELLVENVEHKYHDLAHGITDMFFALDRNLRFTFVNRACEDFIGTSADQILGKHITSILPDTEALRLAKDIYITAIKENSSQTFLTDFFDGKRKSILLVSVYPAGQDISVLVKDVTDQELNKRQLQFQALALQSTLDAMLAIDNDGKVVYFNKAASKLYNIPAEEAYGVRLDNLYSYYWLSKDDEKRTYSDLSQKGAWFGRNIHIKRNGERIFVESAVSVMADQEGNRIGLLAAIRDITDRVAFEQYQEEMGQRLALDNMVMQAIMESTNAHLAYLDRDFNFVMVNQPYAEGSGYSKKKLIGRNHFELFPHGENKKIFENVRDTGRSYSVKAKAFEFEGQPQRGVTYWDWTLSPISDNGGKVIGIVLSLLDVTEQTRTTMALRKSVERLSSIITTPDMSSKTPTTEMAYMVLEHLETLSALQQSEFRLDMLLEKLPCILWTTDEDLNLTSVMGAGMKSMDISERELIGTPLNRWFGNKDKGDIMVLDEHKRALSGPTRQFEAVVLGKTYQCYLQHLSIVSGSRSGLIGLGFDLTRQKKAELAQRALARKLVYAQEAERRDIARELHDEVGQALTALGILLFRAEKDKKLLEQARQSVSNLISTVRAMSHTLRPSVLDDLGLVPALNWYFKQFSEQTGISIHFNHPALKRKIPWETSITVYRIIQEGLNNIVKHAEVSEASVQISVKQDKVSLDIVDKGKGFDPDTLEPGESSGLKGMRERVNLMNGTIRIDSSPGIGTHIQIELPFHKQVKTEQEITL